MSGPGACNTRSPRWGCRPCPAAAWTRGRAPISCMRYRPTILLCTPSYALHLGRVVQDMGVEPRTTACARCSLPASRRMSIAATRERIQQFVGRAARRILRLHRGLAPCRRLLLPALAAGRTDRSSTHLLEDVQVWETVDPRITAAAADGARGLTVCTKLNSEMLAAAPLSRRRLYRARSCALSLRPHAMCGRSAPSPGAPTTSSICAASRCFRCQIEEIVRAIAGTGDEFEIVLGDQCRGLDVMTVRVEHPGHAAGIGRSRGRGNPHALRGAGRRSRCWPRARCPRPSSRRSASRTGGTKADLATSAFSGKVGVMCSNWGLPGADISLGYVA